MGRMWSYFSLVARTRCENHSVPEFEQSLECDDRVLLDVVWSDSYIHHHTKRKTGLFLYHKDIKSTFFYNHHTCHGGCSLCATTVILDQSYYFTQTRYWNHVVYCLMSTIYYMLLTIYCQIFIINYLHSTSVFRSTSRSI